MHPRNTKDNEDLFKQRIQKKELPITSMLSEALNYAYLCRGPGVGGTKQVMFLITNSN